MSWAIFGLVLFLPGGVRGTLTPNGVVALDCGGQQEFTCDVTGITTGNPATGWRINRLFNITAVGANGVTVANDNIRITTTTGGNVPTSTITITNFDMRDDGGTIQCVNTDDASIQGAATISVEIPSCPTNVSANRDGDFTSANVSYQLATPPPVTSTTVTYCPTSSPNCGNSMNCTAGLSCTISGLLPCMEYNLSAIPNNNCGSATGCTGNSMVVPAKGTPPCPTMVNIRNSSQSGDDSVMCDVMLTWEQLSQVTSTTVTYCPTSSPNCSNSMTCTSPCTISGLDSGTEYQFTVIPKNNCGSTTGCPGNNATVEFFGDCTIEPQPPPTWVIIIIVIVVIIVIAGLITAIVFIVICCCCAAVSAWLIATCCCCCKQANKNRNKPERFNRPPDEYADPKKVREKKEKEEKIQYAALEFSEQAGSSGEKPIRSKEEPVQYTSVEQA